MEHFNEPSKIDKHAAKANNEILIGIVIESTKNYYSHGKLFLPFILH